MATRTTTFTARHRPGSLDVASSSFAFADIACIKGLGITTGTMSMAGLLIEISYTRIVSYKLFHYWVYLVIGLALLGIGSGSVFVTISMRLRRASTHTIKMWGSLAAALTVGLGVPGGGPHPDRHAGDLGLRLQDVGQESRRPRGDLVRAVRLLRRHRRDDLHLFGRRAEQIGRLYFASLGFGFIFFEITLIQRLTLFLGYPTYSLTVTLASILLLTGFGALFSGRFKADPRRVLPFLLGAIVVLAPLGICLGMFMPLGLGAVAGMTDHVAEYVAWGWAVNGFASVVGSVLTTMLAMTFGFQVVMFWPCSST